LRTWLSTEHRTLDRSFSIQQALVKRPAKEDKKKVEKATSSAD